MLSFLKDYYTPRLYTEDDIIEIGDQLKALKGKTIIDFHNDFFRVTDYDIKSIEMPVFNWFSKNGTANMFYIDFITLSNGDEDFTHDAEDTYMCSAEGVSILMEHREKFINLRSNYLSFHKSPIMAVNHGG